MASLNRRILFNTRERALSSDQNDQTALVNRNLDNTAAAVAAGIAGGGAGLGSEGGPNLLSGVVDGLSAGPANPGVDLQVQVSAGLAYKVGTAPTSLDSVLRRIELTTPATLDLAPLVAGQPRWVAIEIAPADTVELVSLRDIWQAALNAFVPANIDKIRAPAPILTANAGVAGPVPVLPDGTPGTIPLAYVYLAGGAISLQATDFILCRPLYSSLGQPRVHGGGLAVASTGSSVLTPRDQRGRWSNGSQYRVLSLPRDASNPSVWNAGENFAALAGNNRAVYAYACTAPYPLGYDPDVLRSTREFFNLTSFVPSAPVQTQPLIILSTGAPSSASATGGRALTSADTIWGTGGTISSSESHYLGAVSYVDSAGGFAAQSTSRDEVRVLEPMADPIVQATVTAPAGNILSVDFFPSDVDLLVNTPPPGVGVCAPNNTVNHLIGVRVLGTSTAGSVRVYDANSAGNTLEVWSRYYGATATGTLRAQVWAYSGGTVRLEAQDTSGVGTVTAVAYYQGYKDPILSYR